MDNMKNNFNGVKRIESHTSFTPIRKAGSYKPETPLFLFKNNGNVDVFINGTRLLPGETFGLDNTLLWSLMQEKGIDVVEATNYQISFGTEIIDDALDPNGNVIALCMMIVTKFVKIG